MRHSEKHERHIRLGVTLILLSAAYLVFVLSRDDVSAKWLAAVFTIGVLTGFVAGRRIK